MLDVLFLAISKYVTVVDVLAGRSDQILGFHWTKIYGLISSRKNIFKKVNKFIQGCPGVVKHQLDYREPVGMRFFVFFRKKNI
jgi:hypothetical protein